MFFKFVIFVAWLVLLVEITQGLPSLSGTTFSHDLGSANDLSGNILTSGSCKVSVTGTSAISSSGSRNWREIPINTRMDLECNVSGFDLSSTGVPYVDAIFDVVYYDSVSSAYEIRSKLNYGYTTWFSVMGFGGSQDYTWKTEHALFGSTPWQMVRAIDGILTIGIFASAGPLSIDSFALRFLAHDTFLTERETIRSNWGLERHDYLNGAIPPPPSRPTSEQTFALFTRNYLEKVYKNTVPTDSEISGTVNVVVKEITGETEPAIINAFAFDSLTDVTVSITGISSSVATIEAFEVILEDRRWTWDGSITLSVFGSNPWSLRPLTYPLDSTTLAMGNWNRAWANGVKIEAGTTKQFWLNVKIANDANAGDYSGTITVCGTHFTTQTCHSATLSLTVFKITLGNPKTFSYLYNSPWYWSPEWGFDDKSHVIADQKAHGPISDIIRVYVWLTNFNVNYWSMDEEAQALVAAGIYGDGNGHVRVQVTDNWEDMWELEYGNSNYFQQDSTTFDIKYKKVLQNYSNFFKSHGFIADLEFEDEPSNIVSRRLHVTHFNRLAQELNIPTWVTYFPNCDTPLAGYHEFKFTSPSTLPERKNELPDWIKTDPSLSVLYDFNQANGINTVVDKSGNGNTGYLSSGASVTNNVLEVSTTSNLYIKHNDSLNIVTSGTILLSMRVDACATGFANIFLYKWAGTDQSNYIFYMFGGYGPNSLGVFATPTPFDGDNVGVPGLATELIMPYTSTWHQFLWTFDTNKGGIMYLDNLASGLPKNKGAVLQNSTKTLYLGSFSGAIDNFVMLNRALTDDEIDSITTPAQNYTASITATASSTTTLPSTLRFTILNQLDELPEAHVGTIRKLYVNNHLAWSEIGQDFEIENVEVPISSYIVSGQETTFKFEFINGRYSSEHFLFYIVDNTIRNLVWTESGIQTGWSHSVSSTTDLYGDLAPMSWYLDEAVIALWWSGKSWFDQFKHLGIVPSLYDTYHANVPVPIYNRFIGGLFSAATGAYAVNHYCYGDWTTDPWDEVGGGLGTSRLHNSYGLVEPSWDPMLYSCIPWEMVREGTEDSRIFALLEKEISSHSGSSIAIEAQNWLNNLYSLPTKDYSYYMVVRTSKPIEYYGDTSDRILYDLTGSETEYSFFDETRTKAIEYILQLQQGSCTPKTCSTMNHNCGIWDDGCGTDLNCGSCTSPYFCSITSGICVCTPQSCNSLGYLCGTPLDGCNNILSCGSCTLPETCYYGNCSTACIPKTCILLGFECDNAQDGCGNTINCGSCSQSSKTCVNGKCKDKADSSSEGNNNANHSTHLSINLIKLSIFVIGVVSMF